MAAVVDFSLLLGSLFSPWKYSHMVVGKRCLRDHLNVLDEICYNFDVFMDFPIDGSTEPLFSSGLCAVAADDIYTTRDRRGMQEEKVTAL